MAKNFTVSKTKADRQFIEVLKSGLTTELDELYAKDKTAFDSGKIEAYEDIIASINEYLNDTKDVAVDTDAKTEVA